MSLIVNQEDEFDTWYLSVVTSSIQDATKEDLILPGYEDEPYGPSYGTSGADKAEALYYQNLK